MYGVWQKLNFFREQDIVLFATQPKQWQEFYDMVQLEAMAAAESIVASDMPSTRYLTSPGMQAELVEPDNEAAWVTIISNLLTDGDKRYSAGGQNSVAVQQLAWLLIAEQ